MAHLADNAAMERPLLSICLIVKNEVERLPRCLAPLRPLADEIVIADTGSTDGTLELIRSAGVKVIEFPWCDDFSAARNACLAEAAGEWVLFVDADEVLVPISRGKLERLLRKAKEPAFTVDIVSPRGPGDEEVAHIVRLFRNLPEHRYEGRIHEQVLGSICKRLGVATLTPPPSGLKFQHEGYTPEMRIARGKWERNRRLLLAEIEARPEEPGLRFLFARENCASAGGDLLDLPETREAWSLLRPSVDQLLAMPARGVTEPATALAIRLAGATGHFSEGERLGALAQARLGPTARLVYAQGELLLWKASQGEGDPVEAARLFRKARGAPEGSPALTTERALRDAWAPTRECLALILAGDGRAKGRLPALGSPGGLESLLVEAFAEGRAGGPGAALPILAQGAKREPADPRVWWALGWLFNRLGEPVRSQAMADTALKAAPGWSAAAALPVDPEQSIPFGLLAPLRLL